MKKNFSSLFVFIAVIWLMAGVSCDTSADSQTNTETEKAISDVSVDYVVQNDWGSGFVASVTISNNSGAAIDGWILTWTFPNDQQITNAWNANVTQSGNSVTAENVAWNSTISDGGSISFGFQGTYSGSNNDPSDFAINGESSDGETSDDEPVAVFSIDPSNPQPGESVTVDASDSYDPNGTITAYSWDFGDGGSDTGVTTTHTYATEGDYQVTLTVTDNDGNTANVAKTVTVSTDGDSDDDDDDTDDGDTGTSTDEDTGYDCQIGSPGGSNGGSSSVLPDPFTMWDGTQVQTMEDWRCRRRELVVEAEDRMLGEKAPPPASIGGSVTGSISTSSYTVNVQNPGGSTSFSGTVSLPSSGSAPYPAVIVIGGFNSLNTDVLDSEGVATMSYDAYSIASETSGDFTTGKYYDANPDQSGNTGALVAWAWGVSRIIDMLEKNPGVIDATKIAIHGCSRFGKAAFVIGAFDQRIALGLPTEPGTGGPAPLRALSSLGGQTLSSCIGEASWFGPMASSYSSSMAVDMSDVAAMYAPRGLLLMDNPHIDHLSYKANYLGCAAAYEVYDAMGESDALWYLGNTDNGNHCSVRSEYAEPLRAMIQKFLKGDGSATTGGLDSHSNHGYIDVSGWTSTWNIGTISK